MNRDVDAAAGEFDYLDIDSLVDDWYRRGRYGVDAFAVMALSFFPSSDYQTRKDLIFAWASVF